MKIKTMLFILFLLLDVNIFAEEILTIPSSGESILSSVLSDNTMYIVEAEGTYKWDIAADFPVGYADAEFCYRADEWGGWTEYYDGYLDVLLDGSYINWLGRESEQSGWQEHMFSPDHVYRYYVLGQGIPVPFTIFDNYYDDNEGFLTLSITEIPEPATFLLFSLEVLALKRKK